MRCKFCGEPAFYDDGICQCDCAKNNMDELELVVAEWREDWGYSASIFDNEYEDLLKEIRKVI